MRILADEHVPPAFASALQSEGHDVETVPEALAASESDRRIFEYATEVDRVILTADADFSGASDELDPEEGPGILSCDVDARPGAIATAVRRIDALVDDPHGTVLYVPDGWI